MNSVVGRGEISRWRVSRQPLDGASWPPAREAGETEDGRASRGNSEKLDKLPGPPPRWTSSSGVGYAPNGKKLVSSPASDPPAAQSGG